MSHWSYEMYIVQLASQHNGPAHGVDVSTLAKFIPSSTIEEVRGLPRMPILVDGAHGHR